MPKEDKKTCANIISSKLNYLFGNYYRTLIIFTNYFYDTEDKIYIVDIIDIEVPELNLNDEWLTYLIGLRTHGHSISNAIDMITELAQFTLLDLLEEQQGFGLGG